MGIEYLKNASKNKQLFMMNRDYHNYLKTIIKNALSRYSWVPETEDDIYWLFMFEVPALIKEFQGQEEKEFIKFIGSRCKFFALNHCKTMQTHHYVILNNSISLDDTILSNQMEEELVLHDSIEEEIKTIDVTSLDETELVIYRMFFLEQMQMKDIAKIINISRYKLKLVIDEIRKKLQRSTKK